MDGRNQVAIARGKLELLGLGSLSHAAVQGALQFGVAAFEKELCVFYRACVNLGVVSSFTQGPRQRWM
jgi:hypothetical protein